MRTKSVLLAMVAAVFTVAATAQPRADYRPLHPEKIEYKNFYLTALLGHFDEMRTMLASDGELAGIAPAKIASLDAAADPATMLSAMRISEEEIASIGGRLKSLYRPDNALGRLVADHLLPSGCYIEYRDMTPADMLARAWEQDARGINHVIDVWGEGVRPRYPLIDSISFSAGTAAHHQMVAESTRYLLESQKGAKLFFEPSLEAALLFLSVSGRTEAVDFEPMISGVNKAAYDHVPAIDWDRYPYSAILLLGSGPSNYFNALNPGIRPRLKMIAKWYHAGKAPLLIVSGGRVHPWRTPNSEALEMKRYLMDECGVPEEAIIMDPHARHTTTNVRNAARLMFRAGVPMSKPGLISSSEGHISSVIAPTFERRCLNEMGVKPYELGERLGEQFVEFYPQIVALQIDPLDDPLDP